MSQNKIGIVFSKDKKERAWLLEDSQHCLPWPARKNPMFTPYFRNRARKHVFPLCTGPVLGGLHTISETHSNSVRDILSTPF